MLVAHPDGPLFQRMQEGMDVFPIAAASDVDVAAAWRLSRLLKSERPDVIHAHDSRSVAMAATAIAIVAPTPRPRLVTTRRSEFRPDRTSFSRWKYSQVDTFIATSRSIRERILSEGVPTDRVVVVHPGVDLTRVDRLAAANVHADFFLPTHAPIVGNVGALIPVKGHQHLIGALPGVRREVPDVRLVIAGDGELRVPLEQQIRDLHLERHAFLAGFREDAIELTKGFDVYASTALREGASVAVLDAMAAGKPVVAFAVGHLSDLVQDGETGHLVPLRDDAALAAALTRLLLDEGSRRQMGAAARQVVAERFSIEEMVEGTKEAYREVERWKSGKVEK